MRYAAGSTVHFRHIGLLAFVGLVTVACTHTAALTYRPSTSPGDTALSRTISVRVVDQRENVEPTRIGFLTRGAMSGPLHERRNAAQVISDAVRAGLEADGHRITPEADNPDMAVTVRLRSLWARESGFAVVAAITGDIVVRGKGEGVAPVERQLQFEVTERMLVRLVSVYETALNKAVEQMVDRTRVLVREMRVVVEGADGRVSATTGGGARQP